MTGVAEANQYSGALGCYRADVCLIVERAVEEQAQIFHRPCIDHDRPAEADGDRWA